MNEWAEIDREFNEDEETKNKTIGWYAIDKEKDHDLLKVYEKEQMEIELEHVLKWNDHLDKKKLMNDQETHQKNKRLKMEGKWCDYGRSWSDDDEDCEEIKIKNNHEKIIEELQHEEILSEEIEYEIGYPSLSTNTKRKKDDSKKEDREENNIMESEYRNKYAMNRKLDKELLNEMIHKSKEPEILRKWLTHNIGITDARCFIKNYYTMDRMIRYNNYAWISLNVINECMNFIIKEICPMRNPPLKNILYQVAELNWNTTKWSQVVLEKFKNINITSIKTLLKNAGRYNGQLITNGMRPLRSQTLDLIIMVIAENVVFIYDEENQNLNHKINDKNNINSLNLSNIQPNINSDLKLIEQNNETDQLNNNKKFKAICNHCEEIGHGYSMCDKKNEETIRQKKQSEGMYYHFGKQAHDDREHQKKIKNINYNIKPYDGETFYCGRLGVEKKCNHCGSNEHIDKECIDTMCMF